MGCLKEGMSHYGAYLGQSHLIRKCFATCSISVHLLLKISAKTPRLYFSSLPTAIQRAGFFIYRGVCTVRRIQNRNQIQLRHM